MNYTLSVYDETYPVEDLRLPPEPTMRHHPDGQPYSLVSPIRLPTGKNFILASDTARYELIVNGCFGFAYTGKFFISGTITARQGVPHAPPAAGAQAPREWRPTWGPARRPHEEPAEQLHTVPEPI